MVNPKAEGRWQCWRNVACALGSHLSLGHNERPGGVPPQRIEMSVGTVFIHHNLTTYRGLCKSLFFYRMKYLISAYGTLKTLKGYLNGNSSSGIVHDGLWSNSTPSIWSTCGRLLTIGSFVPYNLSFRDLTNSYASFPTLKCC